MDFHAPWILLLLLILPALAWIGRRQRQTASVRFSSLTNMKRCRMSLRQRLRPLLLVFRLACLALLIVALARPRKGTVLSEISTEGVAIEALVDRSGSMQAEMDYYGEKLNRLDVVKRVLADFVKGDDRKLEGRSGDLIGLITFARYADTLCPLVLSHNVLLEFMKQTNIVRLKSEDGTAIGDGIALAAARLKKAEEEILRRRQKMGLSGLADTDESVPEAFKIKSKAIILLTDGRNNVGQYDPRAAAQLAQEWGIKIYTIGIGSAHAYTSIQTFMGAFKMPTQDDLDEDLLKAIAQDTGAFYSRADDAASLRAIVQKINDMEKTEVKTIQYTKYSERFNRWALPALILLMLEMIASCTVFRKIP
jgi:Ca-activated chloride channel family protein